MFHFFLISLQCFYILLKPIIFKLVNGSHSLLGFKLYFITGKNVFGFYGLTTQLAFLSDVDVNSDRIQVKEEFDKKLYFLHLDKFDFVHLVSPHLFVLDVFDILFTCDSSNNEVSVFHIRSEIGVDKTFERLVMILYVPLPHDFVLIG